MLLELYECKQGDRAMFNDGNVGPMSDSVLTSQQ